ncbi:hypothetical protein NUW54_g11253 [Trametes sanguinea]|uniref:Uncharacterized protein n=1 Tax=Trametes sanguinea TaxID=158606 RepID=A0ACC1NJ82_9APHY|nr:hypothetical protein NUW54_g11253 [Trametes sanguinea]
MRNGRVTVTGRRALSIASWALQALWPADYRYDTHANAPVAERMPVKRCFMRNKLKEAPGPATATVGTTVLSLRMGIAEGKERVLATAEMRSVFYPGLVSPHAPQIGSGESESSGRIGAPDGFGGKDKEEPSAPWGSESESGSGFGRKIVASRPTRVIGTLEHPVTPMPPRKTMIPAMDFLSCYAIAVNEVNASGGRIVTSPTNGAAGVIPAVLKYIVEFVSDDPERSVVTFLLTAAAVGMLFKRGSTISAAEGGCQAEVGVACSMASAGFAACMGASPETVLQAAEIGIGQVHVSGGIVMVLTAFSFRRSHRGVQSTI